MSAHNTDYAAMGLSPELGQNAFTSTRRPSVFATKQALATAKRSSQQAELIDNLRAAGVKVGVLRGLSPKSDELVRQWRERENAITHKKSMSRFNVQIASQAESLRSNSIGGKL